MKNLPESAIKIVVTRRAGHILSPSWELLNDYKSEKINWKQYVERFKHEMDNDRCIVEMMKIKLMANDRQVYLICYEKSSHHCHRSILKQMIEELDSSTNRLI